MALAKPLTKELEVVASKEHPQLFVIRYAGAGRMPEELKGSYSGRANADYAIKLYRANKSVGKKRQPKQGIPNAKAES
jgi:hypothetical protein